MKLFLIATIVFLTLILDYSFVKAKNKDDEIKKGIVKVVAYTPGGPDPVLDPGAGIIISIKDRGKIYVLTAFHVIENADSIFVGFYDDKESDIPAKAKPEKVDEDNDLAVISVENISSTRKKSIFTLGNSTKMTRADSAKVLVKALGHPGSSDWDLSDRTLEENDTSKTYFVTSGDDIEPGHSGGALLNEKNELIGIITSKYSEGPFIALTRRIETAISFLNNWNIPCDLKRKKAPIVCYITGGAVIVGGIIAYLIIDDGDERTTSQTGIPLPPGRP